MLDEMIHNLMDKILITGAYLMDLYMIRRILDKDYITNTITYTGAAHSLDYIRILVKYFGFKLTNYSYLGYDSIEEVDTHIKFSKYYSEPAKIFYPKIFSQCSDITSFSNLFN